MGNRPGYHTPLENAHSIAEALGDLSPRASQKCRAAPGSPPSAASISTISYANPADKTTGRFPTLAELDTVTPNNPVWLSDQLQRPVGHQQRSAEHPSRARRRRRSAPTDRSPARAQATAGRCSSCARRCSTPEERRRATPRRDEVRGEPRRHDAHRPGRLPGDQHRGRRRGARRQLHDAVPVPRDLRARARASVRLRINFLHMETDDASAGAACSA